MRIRIALLTGCFAALAWASTGPAAGLPDAEEPWVRASTTHFTVFSNGGARRALKLGRRLEQLRAVLQESSGGMSMQSPLPTTIFVFRDREAFAPYNLGADGKPSNLAGYFLRTETGNYVAIDGSSHDPPYPVLFHEYLHYVLEHNLPGIPLWLNEGLAEFYSTFDVVRGRAEVGRPVESHLDWLATHPILPLDELFAVDARSPAYHEGGRQGTFYAQSWALVHFLMTTSEYREKMPGFLGLLRRGLSPEAAFGQAFEIDLADLQGRLEGHLESGARRLLRLGPTPMPTANEARSETVEPKEILYRLGDLLANHPPVQTRAAEEHLRAAIALDERYAEAWIALAALRLNEDRPDEAAELCRRGLALAPGNPRAHALYGTALLAGFLNGPAATQPRPQTTPPVVLQARDHFRQALNRQDDHVESLIGLGVTYLFETGDVREGLEATRRACEARPGRNDLLLNLIVLTAKSGELDAAHELLEQTLRPRDVPEIARDAEAELARIGVQRVNDLLAAGRGEEAFAAMRDVVARTHSPELKRDLASQLDLLRDGSGEVGP